MSVVRHCTWVSKNIEYDNKLIWLGHGKILVSIWRKTNIQKQTTETPIDQFIDGNCKYGHGSAGVMFIDLIARETYY